MTMDIELVILVVIYCVISFAIGFILGVRAEEGSKEPATGQAQEAPKEFVADDTHPSGGYWKE